MKAKRQSSHLTKMSSLLPMGLLISFVLGLMLFQACPGNPEPACQSSADCSGDKKCENGKCVTRSLKDGGNNKPDTATTDTTNTKPDTATTDTTNTKPDKGGNKPHTVELGKQCSTNTDCVTGSTCQDPGAIGVKVCITTCQSANGCGAKSLCDIHNGLKTGTCLPKCTTDADCKEFAPLTLCTKNGHCWKRGSLGALCKADDECVADFNKCVDPGGLGPKICTQVCTSDADCKSGLCDTHPGVKIRYCLPKCKGDSDCNTLPHMNLCTQGKHCWRKGWFSSLCFQKRECNDTLSCEASKLGTQNCTKACTSDADCNVDGRTGKCADPESSGKKQCLIPCTGNADCPGHLPVCNNGVCWIK